MGQLLATWLTSGEAPPWLDLRKAAEFRAKQVEPGQFVERNLTCSLYSDPTPQFGVSDAVRVVRAGSSSLIALSFKCKTTFVAAQGGIVDWDSGFEKLYPNEHPSPRLQRPWGATLLVVQPDETSPAIIGVRGGYVL